MSDTGKITQNLFRTLTTTKKKKRKKKKKKKVWKSYALANLEHSNFFDV